jgi:hypothetical protein
MFSKKSSGNYALILGYFFVQFFCDFHLTKSAAGGIMEFSRQLDRWRGAEKRGLKALSVLD